MSTPAAIRILIVDDVAIVREGLIAMLEGQPDIELVGAAANEKDVLALVGASSPDVVLLDLGIATIGGLTILQAIKQAKSKARIVILTSLTDEECVSLALKAGADCYLPKDAACDHVLATIRRLMT
jgi:DNA-binding NarL/FixJ family response regulator